MDLFKNFSKQSINEYLTSYLKARETPQFFSLERKRKALGDDIKLGKDITPEEQKQISDELISFYRAVGDSNPFNYFSKLKFILGPVHIRQDMI